MKTYLIQITIGPVQDFIASARKLRDLWFGSDLLSELSKTIARSLQQQGGELIFPCIEDKSELAKDSELIVANKILLRITTDKNPAAIINNAKSAWIEHRQEIADISLKKMQQISAIKHNINKKLFTLQQDDFGEFFAAWVEQEQPKDYYSSKNQLEKLLASRKNLREFSAPQWDGEGIPKSSLDGMREAVIGDQQAAIKGLLKKNERLDALACIKRFYPLKNKKRTCFDDLSYIALSSYKRVSEEYDNANLIAKFTDKFRDEEGGAQYSEIFYYDKKELQNNHALQEYKAMKAVYGEPNKYACVLMGDGDHMGKALDAIKTAEGHQYFSRQLGLFAKNIELTISNYQGSLIYAGGDDVMAYVPLHTAIDCADKVQQEFVKIMQTIKVKLQLKIATPTFSIGMAIVHHSEPLDNALELARQAEQMAKHQAKRNALAIIQHKRGGSDLSIYGHWHTDTNVQPGIVQRLQLMSALHQKNILPSTLGYQLRQARIESGDTLDYDKHSDTLKANNASAALVQRIVQQKSQADSLQEKLQTILKHQTSIRQLSDEMVIARQFSEDQMIINNAQGKC